MKRALIIIALLLVADAFGADDTLYVPLILADSAGNVNGIALASGDSVAVAVVSPIGDSVYALKGPYNAATLKTLTVGGTKFPNYFIRVIVASPRIGTYAYTTVAYRNGGTGWSMPKGGTFSCESATRAALANFDSYTGTIDNNQLNADVFVKVDGGAINNCTTLVTKTGFSLASGGLDGVTQASGSVIFSNTSIGSVTTVGTLTNWEKTGYALSEADQWLIAAKNKATLLSDTTAKVSMTATGRPNVYTAGICTTIVNGVNVTQLNGNAVADSAGHIAVSHMVGALPDSAIGANAFKDSSLELGVFKDRAFNTIVMTGLGYVRSNIVLLYGEGDPPALNMREFFSGGDTSAGTGGGYDASLSSIGTVTTLTTWSKTGYSLASNGLDGVTQASGSVVFSNTSIAAVTDVTNPVDITPGSVDAIWDEDSTGHGVDSTMGWLASQTAAGGGGATLSEILHADLSAYQYCSHPDSAFMLGTLLYIAGDTSGTIWSSLADLANRMADSLTDSRGVMQRHDVDPTDTAYIKSAKIDSIFDDVIVLGGWNPLTDAIVVPVTNINGDTILTVNITYDANTDTVKNAIVVGMKKDVMADSNFKADAITDAKVANDVSVKVVEVQDATIKAASLHTDYWDSLAVLTAAGGGGSVSLGALISDTASVDSATNANNYFLTTLATPMPYDKYLHQYMTFTSGDYDGFTRLIVADTNAVLTIIPPLGGIPSVGDDFTIWAFANMNDSATFESDYWAAIANAGGGGGLLTLPDSFYVDLFRKIDTLITRMGLFGDSAAMQTQLDLLSYLGQYMPLFSEISLKIGAYTGVGNSNIKNAIEGIVAGGCAGTGSRSCTLFVGTDAVIPIPIANAKVEIKNLAQAEVKAGPIYTSMSGENIVNLDPDDYVVIITAYHCYDLVDTITVNQDSSWILKMASWALPSVADTGMCNVYVETKDLFGAIVKGAKFTITPIMSRGTHWMTSNQDVYIPAVKTVTTDSLGRAWGIIYQSGRVKNELGDSLKYNFEVQGQQFRAKFENRVVPTDSTLWKVR